MTITFTGSNPVAFMLLKSLPLVLIALLTFNMIQKRFIKDWGKKRLATFYLACGVLLFLAAAFGVFRAGISDFWLLPAAGALLVIAFLKRGSIFPFYRRCDRCRRGLTLFEIFLRQGNLCKSCHSEDSR